MKSENTAKTKRIVIRPTMKNFFWLLLPNRVTWLLILGPLLSLASGDPYMRSGGIIMFVAAMMILLIHLSIKVNTRLIVYPFGVEYREPGCRIIARWKDIRRILTRRGPRTYREELLVSKQAIATFDRFFVLLRRKHNLLKIPMTQFDKEWKISDWGKFICTKAGLTYWR
jgi:hypothetical protein